MLYPLSYRRKASLVYRGGARVATGSAVTFFVQVQLNRVWQQRIMLPSVFRWG